MTFKDKSFTITTSIANDKIRLIPNANMQKLSPEELKFYQTNVFASPTDSTTAISYKEFYEGNIKFISNLNIISKNAPCKLRSSLQWNLFTAPLITFKESFLQEMQQQLTGRIIGVDRKPLYSVFKSKYNLLEKIAATSDLVKLDNYDKDDFRKLFSDLNYLVIRSPLNSTQIINKIKDWLAKKNQGNIKISYSDSLYDLKKDSPMEDFLRAKTLITHFFNIDIHHKGNSTTDFKLKLYIDNQHTVYFFPSVGQIKLASHKVYPIAISNLLKNWTLSGFMIPDIIASTQLIDSEMDEKNITKSIDFYINHASSEQRLDLNYQFALISEKIDAIINYYKLINAHNKNLATELQGKRSFYQEKNKN